MTIFDFLAEYLKGVSFSLATFLTPQNKNSSEIQLAAFIGNFRVKSKQLIWLGALLKSGNIQSLDFGNVIVDKLTQFCSPMNSQDRQKLKALAFQLDNVHFS